MRVLIADDDARVRNQVRVILEKLGHDVRAEDNGRKAVEALKDGDFDAVILDVVMPEMDGLEALFRMREISEETPVIMLSAEADAKTSAECIKAGAQDYLDKPLRDMNMLAIALDRAAEKNRLILENRQLMVDLTRANEELRNREKHLERLVEERTENLKRANERLKDNRLKLVEHERMRALGEMASGLAHDFNNCLSPILGFTELLLARPKSMEDVENVKSRLEIIRTAAGDAAKVVARMREFYKRHQELLAVDPVGMNEVVAQAVSLLEPRWKMETRARGAAVDIRTELSDVPTIRGDESQLREVLANVMLNAMDAMPGGGTITVRTGATKHAVVLEVSDTGEGMTEEVRQRCQDPFFSTKGEKGTGLGLAVSHGIIRRHGGKTTIDSAPGGGTTVRIELPVWEARKTALKVAEEVKASGPLSILVVDDEEPILAFVSEFLTGIGHSVQVAEDGEKGLDLFRAGEFDAVIVDQVMPGMTGHELAAEIKKIDPNVPVIMQTGFGELIEDFVGRSDDIDLVLDKPIELSHLERSIGRLVATFLDARSAGNKDVGPGAGSVR